MLLLLKKNMLFCLLRLCKSLRRGETEKHTEYRTSKAPGALTSRVKARYIPGPARSPAETGPASAIPCIAFQPGSFPANARPCITHYSPKTVRSLCRAVLGRLFPAVSCCLLLFGAVVPCSPCLVGSPYGRATPAFGCQPSRAARSFLVLWHALPAALRRTRSGRKEGDLFASSTSLLRPRG